MSRETKKNVVPVHPSMFLHIFKRFYNFLPLKSFSCYSVLRYFVTRYFVTRYFVTRYLVTLLVTPTTS